MTEVVNSLHDAPQDAPAHEEPAAGEPPAPDAHDEAPHLHYVPFYAPPLARQAWVKQGQDEEGRDVWVNSLSLQAPVRPQRTATPADLVLDLVFVVLLAQLEAEAEPPGEPERQSETEMPERQSRSE